MSESAATKTVTAMSNERLLLDTVFVQALFNQRDQYHSLLCRSNG